MQERKELEDESKEAADFRYHFATAQSSLNRFLEKHNLHLLLRSDHIAYKCVSHEEYEAIIKFLISDISIEFVEDETLISGRMISLVHLGSATYLPTLAGKLEYLELQDQKPDGSQKSRFDHYELVPKFGAVEDVIELINQKGLTISIDKKPHHTTWIITDPDMQPGDPKIKIAAEPLIDKIKREKAAL